MNALVANRYCLCQPIHTKFNKIPQNTSKFTIRNMIASHTLIMNTESNTT